MNTLQSLGHAFSARVYYADTDAGGVMYHAAYLNFAERARTEALRDAGLPHAEMSREHGVAFMVRRAELEYLRPALLDDVVEIRTECLACTAATATLAQSFHARGAELAKLRVMLACVRQASGTPARIPPAWRAALSPAAEI